MRINIIFCFVLCTLITHTNPAPAQQSFGQIVVNVGVGVSPGFDGNIKFYGYGYPVNPSYYWDPELTFTCKPITPNLGCTIDIGIIKWLSIGIASSYQSETVDWTSSSNSTTYSDEITRINMAGRILFHLTTNKYVDDYVGLRIGTSYYKDIPSSTKNESFLNQPNSFSQAFQVLFGMRVYWFTNIGFQFEVGLGEPYLLEGGITMRISTHKASDESKQPNMINEKKS